MPAAATPNAGTRRAWCCAAALSACWLAACATSRAKPQAPGGLTEVAAGVYMVQGALGEAGPENLGRVGNAGFIVGPTGVIAIDSGTSYRHGQALLQAIRGVTDQPLRLLLLTHTRQEFLFGAAAYREHGVPVRMHARAAGLMAARCAGCLKTLRRVLGDTEMQATAVLKPDQVFDASHTLALAGRPVRVLYHGHSSGPGDSSVFDEQTGVLFAGGLLDHGRIPDVQDSDLPGWRQALAATRSLPLRHIVPGHGPVAPPHLVGRIDAYLSQLESGARALLRAGAALSEVPDGLALPDFKDWDQYETIHRRNAAVIFLRLEQEQLMH